MNNIVISSMEGNIIYKNNHVNNIYEACTCCYDNTKCIPYDEKKEYISKRINVGHESMLEHGRLAIKITNIKHTSLITELTTLEYSKWLEFYTIHNTDDTYILIINGNMRSYKHFFVNTTEDDHERNSLIRIIHSLLINNTVGALYGTEFTMYKEKPDFVEIEGFFDEQEEELESILLPHNGIEYDTVKHLEVKGASVSVNKNTTQKRKSISFGIDKVAYNRLINDIDISTTIIDRIIPITILFNNMSRTATHQLVRHRNAITQESQRYVSYNDASFTIPVPEYSEDSKKHNITLFGVTKEVTLQDLSRELMSVYTQLVNSGLKKEEARGYLPSNVNCRRLYMTFTIESFWAFIKLRCDEHAQYEIRQYANASLAAFRSVLDDIYISLESSEDTTI